MNIRGKKVLLRAIEEDDLEAFHAWGNDPDLWNMLGGWHFPASKASTRAWIERLATDQHNVRLAIETPELGLVGMANLTDIDWKNNHAFHGMMLGNPKARGFGLAQDVIMTVMRYVFDELHFERLDGSMIEYNRASIRMYCGKCGWKEEGRQRSWYFRQGRYWDRVLVGVTREDYRALCESGKYWD